MEDHIARFLSSPSCPDTNVSTGSSSVGIATSMSDSFYVQSAEPYGVESLLTSGCMMGSVPAEDVKFYNHESPLMFASEHQAPENNKTVQLHDAGSLLHWQDSAVYEDISFLGQEAARSNPLDVYSQLLLAHANSAEGYRFSVPSIRSPCSQVHLLSEQRRIQSFGYNEDMKTLVPPQEPCESRVPNFVPAAHLEFNKATKTVASQKVSQWTDNDITHFEGRKPCELPQHQPAASNGNSSVKPRARARRGQATDPHSIAERLRREKISERMKNLQELVPKANKADKASMLDEIIEYVKFLQLQVKILSMSRLGAAGAVLPLISESQAEQGIGGLIMSSPLSELGVLDASVEPPQDSMAFEQEVVKLLETNISSAMQFLQTKGLCLMPVALASPITNQKGTAFAAVPPERRDAESVGFRAC